MPQLGHTRSAHRPDHLLQTADTFIRAPLPGMKRATTIVHMAPAGGAAFTQYSVEFEAGGELAPGPTQRFLYVLAGAIDVGSRSLEAGGFAYLASADRSAITAQTPSLATVIEKAYEPLDGRTPPSTLFGVEGDVTPTYLMDDPWLEVRSLVPDEEAFDFRVNTMTFQPGATLPMVEIHVMEHGLLMLEGGGIYRLGDCWYPVAAGDFIWMAPYCPQWFGALGKLPAKYLIYKDWSRHPR